jgi:glycosyltransferase involved in cell wall biosynthesis
MHVITCLDVGGAELTLQKLILADPAAVDRHTVVSLRDIGCVGRELQARGVRVYALGMSPTRLNFGKLIKLARMIRESRPAVIQTWLYHGDFFGGLAARIAGRREIIWGIRNTGFARESSRLTYWIMRACGLLSSFVPRVIVCCAESARTSHVGWGYSQNRIRVIPNGFVLPDLTERPLWRRSLRAELGLGQDDLVVGMVARFDPLKNHALFVRAAGLLAQAHPRVRFLLVGRNVDRDNAQLTSWISRSGFPERFVLTGERRDVNRCLAAMDLFCLTSTFEAFPNVVAEAMAMGVPCVVTDAGDAGQIVGNTGWVVPVRDLGQLGEALNEVVKMSQEELRARGELSRQRIDQHFSITAVRQMYELAYRDAVADREASNSAVEGN